MKRLTALTTAVLLAAGMATVGCNKCKEEFAALQQQYNDLQAKDQDLQKALANCQANNADLMARMDGKDAEVARAKGELANVTAAMEALKKKYETPGTGTGTPTGKAPKGWQETSTGAKIAVGSDVLFAPGRAGLSAAGKTKIQQIAATIKTTYPGALVKVYGFTDSDPIKKTKDMWADNLDLSANRAMEVSRMLVSLGIPAAKIETIAMGATHFEAANTTAADKAKNRRVEIVVVK